MSHSDFLKSVYLLSHAQNSLFVSSFDDSLFFDNDFLDGDDNDLSDGTNADGKETFFLSDCFDASGLDEDVDVVVFIKGNNVLSLTGA